MTAADATPRPAVLAEPPFRVPRDRADLQLFLQAALTLEHLTIPPYLTAMYTMRAGTNRPAFFVIRSVVLEEMLHMTLVANLLNAVGGRPLVAHSRFVSAYPTRLPFSKDGVTVALRHFGVEALETFLAVERPAYVAGPPGHPSVREDDGWTSVGQFYRTIREGVLRLTDGLGERELFNGDPARQVGPRDFYDSGGEVFPVTDLASALTALRVITEQGEGADRTVFDSDDRLFGEARQPAHYFRFDEILRQRSYGPHDTPATGPTGPALPVTWHDAYPIDPAARAADYPPDGEVRRAADRFDDVYARLLCVLEQAFTGDPGALRRTVPTMLELRDLAGRLCRNPHPDPARRARGLYASPTYEITGSRLARARSEPAG
ncbi:ferritin-like domain-containing protein [Streptomyces hesseae]|uniref:Ferritin-like protein n=1 Tax=Streptomyces hesseae TaxID=3075519 RepID=A0ABU2SHW6_9ACTN|nr:ferritin-like protein [Streptomyces sp. DSM 40473]MDT0447979.1 ferritin-like protein [Streptomyces sp. DSM 40473]